MKQYEHLFRLLYNVYTLSLSLCSLTAKSTALCLLFIPLLLYISPLDSLLLLQLNQSLWLSSISNLLLA